jgi:hypothetical protein
MLNASFRTAACRISLTTCLLAMLLVVAGCNDDPCRNQWDNLSSTEKAGYPFNGDYSIYKVGCQLANVNNQ